MKFEIGKYYQHTCGKKLSIIGELETTMYRKTLIAETNEDSERLMAVGRDECNAANYKEITKEQWMESFK